MTADARQQAERVVDRLAYDMATHRDDYDSAVRGRRDALVSALAAAKDAADDHVPLSYVCPCTVCALREALSALGVEVERG